MTRQRRVALAALLVLAVACASASHATYITIGSAKQAVDLAMRTWADYVVTTHPPKAQEDQVRAAYAKVQATARAAAVTLELANQNPTPQEISNAVAALVSLVETFTGKKLL